MKKKRPLQIHFQKDSRQLRPRWCKQLQRKNYSFEDKLKQIKNKTIKLSQQVDELRLLSFKQHLQISSKNDDSLDTNQSAGLGLNFSEEETSESLGWNEATHARAEHSKIQTDTQTSEDGVSKQY
eukprot:TRINITY_DN7132_c1_g1_i2.p2 TRINITY_DN7132_c1_g1~~TRINITY_DN7132_c1_g1_i2.p2  ORF type:complete len:125 (-),score=9.76 TRINITY_DN7132_c1_g1_i2:1-375(-)